jgi:hypothetical protein
MLKKKKQFCAEKKNYELFYKIIFISDMRKIN